MSPKVLPFLIVQGILPVSGLSIRAVSLESDGSHSPHMFEITSERKLLISAKMWRQGVNSSRSVFCAGPMVDSKVFACASAGELQKWIQHIEDRHYKSMTQPTSPSHCALSYLVMFSHLLHIWLQLCLAEAVQLTLCTYFCPLVAMWWTLEKRGAEKILTAVSHLGVGGLAYTPHGSAGIHLYCSHHQHSKTGSLIVISRITLNGCSQEEFILLMDETIYYCFNFRVYYSFNTRTAPVLLNHIGLLTQELR